MTIGVSHNGIVVSVQRWDSHKHPVLAVRFEDENRVYKVASFNSEETAHWFEEIMEEFFKGIVKEDK